PPHPPRPTLFPYTTLFRSAGLLVDAAPVAHGVLERLVRVGGRPGDRVAETLRELPVERLAEVPAHHVDAEGERQARVALPGLAEVEDLHEPELTVGDLSLMNQQAHVCLSFKNSLRNLIERDLDQRRVADVETEQQGRRRV